jgi:hypothetical protein
VLVIVMRVGALDGPPPRDQPEAAVERELVAEGIVLSGERGDAAGDEDE